MACRKQLFGNESYCIGSVTKASGNKSVEGVDRSAAGSPEAGTSSNTPGCSNAVAICTPGRVEVVDAALTGAGPSGNRCLLSPLPTLTASEMATPNANIMYTHKEDIDPALIPRPGMVFKDRKAARIFFNSYAAEVGFGLRKAANVREEHARDVEKLLEFFEGCEAQNPQFRWYVKLDKEGAIHSLFWSHASMQAEYIDFGDVMTFDTTHKTNIYDKPLAMFVGANHHLKNTYFGCALLGDETIETFQWVFQAFKKCMGKNKTKCILTDQDQAMEVAIGLEFPEVIHRICRWHVVNKHMPKLNELFELFKKQKFKDKFRSVLNHPLTPVEFERAWEDLVTEFELKENSTMESLYRQRARYIPAFFKDDYCGMMTSTQRSESSNHAIKNGFVGKQTCLHKFAKRVLDFMEISKLKEGTETYLATCKTLIRSKWPFAVQLGRVYTRAVFKNFEKKMFDCSAYNIEGDPTVGENCYRVWHSNKSETIIWGQHKFLVKADKEKEAYSCECKEWDHTGLFCVHLLRAFIEVKVERIPHQYIFQRYTRNARSDVDFDTNDKLLTGEDGNTQSYRTKTLIPIAMKAVRAGSMSSAAHKRLLEVLEEVTKK